MPDPTDPYPSAPLPAGTLHLYDTLTNALRPFTPADPEHVTFYTCGPTVYDDAHIGNFRSFLAADLLRRFIESPFCTVLDDAGAPRPGPRRVTHVMNITDVGHMTDDQSLDGAGEDKMKVAERRLAEAKKSGKLPPGVDVDPSDPFQIAAFYADRFLEDAARLGLKVAIEGRDDRTLLPRATHHVPGMIALIARLIERGHAYAVGEPGRQTVYFDVQSFPDYGRLSGNTLDKLRGGAGGRVQQTHQQEKRHPADFLLWKSDPRHIMKWPSPWGEGYPGWHIECSAMALGRLTGFMHDRLGDPAHAAATLAEDAGAAARAPEIDIHSGGEDNLFPHHECEIAQSRGATGAERFARFWFHPRFLMVEGEKMSKSRGNFYTARDLFAQGHEPAAVRLALVGTHYRQNANFTMDALRAAARQVERWRRFLDEAQAAGAGAAMGAAAEGDDRRRACREKFAVCLADDLNVSGAIAAVNEWISATDRPSGPDAELMREIDAVLGVLTLPRLEQQRSEIALYKPGVSPSPEIEDLLHQRAEARKARDFAAADAIRDRLAEMGLAIKDAPGGKVEVAPR